MKDDFDLVVIGAGAAGLFAASVASSLGAKVALIEKNKLGGDCTWFGCMPSKAIIRGAHVSHLIKNSSLFNINLNNFSLGTDGVFSYVKKVVDEISSHHPAEVFEKRGIKVIFGRPQFINKTTIEINNTKISAKKFIICTGSHPLIPPIKGLENIAYLTNETVFSLNKVPQSLIVLGAGPIGLELTQSFHRLGAEVKVVEMLERPLIHEEPEVSYFLKESLENEGIEILLNNKIVEFIKEDKKVVAVIEDKKGERKKIEAEAVLLAGGRSPNTKSLGLEKAGINYNRRGIEVNSYLQTTNPYVFACGDVIGGYMFSHIAAYEAAVAVRNALFRRLAWQKANYKNVCWATFTHPEVSHLGLGEEEAKKIYPSVKVYKTDYTSSERAITDCQKEGFLKIIADKKGNILGAHIIGANASEIMASFIVAKSANISLDKLSRMIFIYPTLSELVKKTASKKLLEVANNPFIKFVIKIMKK